jgi:putative DNA primase/helicase
MWRGDCITNSDHRHEAKFILHADGWVSYGCFHASCANVKHREFFAHWDEETGEDIPYPGKRNKNWDWAGIMDDGAADSEMPSEDVVPKTPKAFNLTDSGNMERLVYTYGHLFRYCPQRGNWFGWDGHRWENDEKGRIIRAAREVARRIIPDEFNLHVTAEEEKVQIAQAKAIQKFALYSESRAGLVNTEFVSRSAVELAANIEEFDTDLWLFNAANGTVDLRSFEFREHRQADMITHISPVNYDANAKCPLWMEFLDDIMAGNQELVGFLQRAAGISMTGSTVDHALYILYGTGRNGKSTFLEALRHPLGSYARVASMQMFLQQKYENIPNDLAALAGARFVSAAESAEGRKLDEAKIKLLTGGDKITARFMREEFFEFTPQFKIWLATNHKPQIVGDDEAIWRRIKLIPFKVCIPDGKEDETLPGKLRAEASGILNWMLEGLREYRLGGLAEPAEVIVATGDYRKSEDWMDRFLDSEIERVDKELGRVQSRNLYSVYKMWAEDVGEYTLSERRFGEAMRDRGWEYKAQKGGTFVQGMRLRDDDLDRTDPQVLEDLAKM